MKSTITFSAIAILFLLSCQTKDRYFDKAICIDNITTIDPEQGLKENQTIIVKDGKIFKIFNTNELNLAKENTIIDGTGKFLIPGLWDAHVHFAYIEELAPTMFDLFLANGITSVRDTGGKIDFVKKWKDQSLANSTDAPRVMIAGPLLDGMPNVYDGSSKSRPELSVGSKSIEDLTAQMKKLDSLGVDFFKAYEMLTPEQFKTIIDFANKKGLKVTGHVPLSMDAISASEAGIHSMEHMRNVDLSCASNAEELLSERIQLLLDGKDKQGGDLRSGIHKAQREKAIENYDEAKSEKVIQTLLKNDTWQVPTLALNTFFARKYFVKPDWIEQYQYLPDSIGSHWTKRSKALETYEVKGFSKKYVQWNIDMVGKIHKAGITIMAGTDTPIAYLTPGRSLHEELLAFVEAGMTPMEALKTATINPAKYFGLDNELGSISENMWADLVILNSNPLDDINNTTSIEAIFKHGKYHSRKDLDKKLENLKSK